MKEKILGKTVGKAGISQVLIIKTTFIMAICIILGFFLVISSLVNWGKNYFYLNLENGSDNVGFLVIEVENKENLINNNLEKITINLKLNRMASKLFVKNYIEFVFKDKLSKDLKNKNNFDFKFGIIEENNLMKDKIFNLNMDKNLEKVKISEYIFLDKNGIRMENQKDKILENYFWKEIGKITVLENKNNKNIQIEKKTGEVVFSKNMKYIEKPELSIKIIKTYFLNFDFRFVD